MKFREQLKQSFYGPAFYQSLKAKPVPYSIKYYLKLVLILALLGTIFLSIIILPQVTDILFNFKKAVETAFPTELEVKITNGQVSTNVVEPYNIDWPANFSNHLDQIKNLDHLLVIDTKVTEDVVAKFNDYKTLILVTDRFVVYHQDDKAGLSPVVIEPLPTDTNVVINKANTLSLIDRFDGYFVLVPPLFVLLIFVAISIGFLIPLIYLLLIAFIVLVLYKLFGSIKEKELDYATAYQMTLHASTVGFVGSLLVMFLIPSVNLPFLFTILTFLAIFVNVQGIRNLK